YPSSAAGSSSTNKTLSDMLVSFLLVPSHQRLAPDFWPSLRLLRSNHILKWKPDKKCSSLPHFALKPKFSAMLLDDRGMGQRQPFSCTAAYIFRCEERLKNSGPDRFRNPRSIVLNADLHPVSIAPRGNGDNAFLLWVRATYIANRMSRINNEV